MSWFVVVVLYLLILLFVVCVFCLFVFWIAVVLVNVFMVVGYCELAWLLVFDLVFWCFQVFACLLC